MGQDIDAHHIRQAEAARAGPTEGAAREHVHFFHGKTLLLHELDGLGHDIDANAIGNEIWSVAGVDHRLTQATVGKVGNGGNRGRIGLRGGDDLEQAHVAWRVEEVGAEPGTAECRRQLLGDAGYRQTAGVGGEDDSGLEKGGDPGENFSLDGKVFCHRFQHPIAFGEKTQVMIEGSGLDEPEAGWIIKSGRFRPAEVFQCNLRYALAGISGQVEQNYGYASVGQMGRDAHTHGSRTQDGGLLNHPRPRRRGTERRGGDGFHCGRRREAHGSDFSLSNVTLLRWQGKNRAREFGVKHRFSGIDIANDVRL